MSAFRFSLPSLSPNGGARSIGRTFGILLSDDGLENAMDVSGLDGFLCQCYRGRMSSCRRNGCGGFGILRKASSRPAFERRSSFPIGVLGVGGIASSGIVAPGLISAVNLEPITCWRIPLVADQSASL
jgi:hypothetical protein